MPGWSWLNRDDDYDDVGGRGNLWVEVDAKQSFQISRNLRMGMILKGKTEFFLLFSFPIWEGLLKEFWREKNGSKSSEKSVAVLPAQNKESWLADLTDKQFGFVSQQVLICSRAGQEVFL